MTYVSVRDWCDDCAWEWSSRKGITQMHTYPCNCICHHPQRILDAVQELKQLQAAQATQISTALTVPMVPQAGPLERLAEAIRAGLHTWRTGNA